MITKGTTPTTIGYDFLDQGINFVKIESISESGKFLPGKFAHISIECHKELRRSQLENGDILFSIAGALGRVGIVDEEILPANTNQALSIIILTGLPLMILVLAMHHPTMPILLMPALAPEQ